MIKSYIITKTNDLIQLREILTEEEQKLILYFASIIKSDEEYENYEIEMTKLLEITNKNTYIEVLNIIDSIMGKTITINLEKSILKANFISSLEYFNEKDIIEISFNPKLKMYLLNYKEDFEKDNKMNIISLNSYYSIKIYELLKDCQKDKEKIIELEELKDILEIDENQYPRYANLKQKILTIAQREINEKTDIKIEFEEIKRIRKVRALKFTIESKENLFIKENKKRELEIKIKIDTLRKIMNKDMTDKEYKEILDKANGDMGQVIEKYYSNKAK